MHDKLVVREKILLHEADGTSREMASKLAVRKASQLEDKANTEERKQQNNTMLRNARRMSA
jgi:hypothetical protein